MHIESLFISRISYLVPRITIAGNDIHRPHQRRGAVDAGSGTFEHFNALDVGKVARQVHGVVGSLRVADIDAVEQDDDLLLSAAPDADVSLRANGTALADIDADGQL